MLKRDLLGTKLSIVSEIGKAFNMDTILISDFTRINKNTKRILDIGTGNGAILLYLSQKFKGELIGVEIQENRYKVALENIKLNELEEQIKIFNEDVKSFNLKKKADIIVSNPPYFKVNEETKQSIDLDMRIAKHELTLTLEELIIAARKNIKHGGQFFFVHKADRLDEIMHLLYQYDFSVKRIRFVYPRIDLSPNQVLIEAHFKGKQHLTVLPPLIQYHSDQTLTEEMKSIYEGRSYKNEYTNF